MRAWISWKGAIQLWEGPQGGGAELRAPKKIPKRYVEEFPVALAQAERAFNINGVLRLLLAASPRGACAPAAWTQSCCLRTRDAPLLQSRRWIC